MTKESTSKLARLTGIAYLGIIFTGIFSKFRVEVSMALSDGIPNISETSRRLGMSSRTLQRRLTENGYSYQRLIDEARRTVAQKLLRQTEYSLQEVAFLTGFSEQSTFTRAFKRWVGQTPRAYRLAARP